MIDVTRSSLFRSTLFASLTLGGLLAGCNSRAPAPLAEQVGTSRGALSYAPIHTFVSNGVVDNRSSPEGGAIVNGGTIYGTSGGFFHERGTVYTVGTNGSGFSELHAWDPKFVGESMMPGKLTLQGTTLYGTTTFDGARQVGTVYKMGTDGGGFTVLHEFRDDTNAENTPVVAPLVLSGSTLYGMTRAISSSGTVFQVSTNGTGYAVVHWFDSAVAGLSPEFGLVQSGSTLYGVTTSGGAHNAGILFAIDTTNNLFSVLHAFGGASTDPGVPASAPIVIGGALYGTTNAQSGASSLYRIGLDGKAFTVLRSPIGYAHNTAVGGDRLASIGASIYGCDGVIHKMAIDGSRDEMPADPRSPSDLIGCDGDLGVSGTTLFVSRKDRTQTTTDGVLFKLDEGAFAIHTTLEPDNGSVASGQFSCTPVDWIPPGGASTCTITPLAGYAVRKLVDNGVDVRAKIANGTYTVANINEDHTIVAGFGAPGGSACTSTTVCAVGSCIDGICCDRACGGQCEACDVPGHEGTCSLVTGPPRGNKPACTTDNSVCGGKCDGVQATRCKYPNLFTTCGTPSCTNGVATPTPRCSGNGHCNTPTPVNCSPFTCGDKACKTDCQVDGDCAAGSYCAANGCHVKVANGGQCSGDNACVSSHCVDSVCCNSLCDGQCEACDVKGSVGTCSAAQGKPHGVRAACAGDGSVCSGQCDGSERLHCAFPTSSQVCLNASCSGGVAVLETKCDGLGACPAQRTQSCAPFTCGGTACRGDCTVDSDCASGDFCAAGVCVAKRATGEKCGGKGECATGACVDGVCCNSACTDQCAACDVSGHEGTCSPVNGPTHGARTACESDGSSCGGHCDGVKTDACIFPGSSMVCRTPSCDDGVATLAGTCGGDGHCGAVQLQKCAPFTCGGSACNGNCKADSDCEKGAFCSGNVCIPKLDQGAACGGDTQCGTGQCVDGVCCDSACTDQCAACNVAFHEGTCSPLTGAPRGGRAACAGSGACAGQCDGTTTKACRMPGHEKVCSAASCLTGVARGEGKCDGSGTCDDSAPAVSCGAYACSGSACAKSCSSDASCAPGHVCKGNACVPGSGENDAGADASADASADAAPDAKGPTPPASANDGGVPDPLPVDGGSGCSCSEVGGARSPRSPGWAGLGFAGLLATVLARRTRRSSTRRAA